MDGFDDQADPFGGGGPDELGGPEDGEVEPDFGGDGAEPDFGGDAEDEGFEGPSLGDSGGDGDLGGLDGGGEEVGDASGGGDAFAAAESGPYREWERAFREACEQKDEAEREAQEARRSAAKDAMRKWVEEKQTQLEVRKAGNREHDEQAQQRLDDELEGESWERVHSLVEGGSGEDAGAAGGGDGEGSSSEEKKKKEEAVDTARMKDILIHLKARGLKEA